MVLYTGVGARRDYIHTLEQFKKIAREKLGLRRMTLRKMLQVSGGILINVYIDNNRIQADRLENIPRGLII